jgi:hypothetical protein
MKFRNLLFTIYRQDLIMASEIWGSFSVRRKYRKPLHNFENDIEETG